MTRQDFKDLADQEFSLEEQIKELIYELALRESAYFLPALKTRGIWGSFL